MLGQGKLDVSSTRLCFNMNKRPLVELVRDMCKLAARKITCYRPPSAHSDDVMQ